MPTEDAARGAQFSAQFCALDRRSQIVFALKIAKAIPGEPTRIESESVPVVAAVEAWLQDETPSTACQAFEAYCQWEPACIETDLRPDEAVFFTAISFAVQHLAWQGVETGHLEESSLHSGFFEGDWWFRMAAWEASTDREALALLCEDPSGHDVEQISPFSGGVADHGMNDGDIDRWIAMGAS